MTGSREAPQTSPAERVWSRLPAATRSVLEDELSATDLQTLLLDLSRTRARRVTPSRLGRRWLDDRFVQPSSTDPRRLADTEVQLWDLLPPEFAGLALSPVAPLGSCTALGPVDQNRVLSTVRSSEVVSDPTNVLALEAARRRRAGQDSVHLAAHHRVLRNQQFAPGAPAHFTLFTVVSSARDSGAARTEARLLVLHLRFWSDVTARVLPAAAPRIQLTVLDPAVRDRVTTPYAPPWPGAGSTRRRTGPRGSGTTGRPRSRWWWEQNRPLSSATAASPTGPPLCSATPRSAA